MIFANIAGFAAIGLVVTMIYFQSRQRKFTGLIEIFKLLNGKEQREARGMLFEAYRKYKKTNDDSIFEDEHYREHVNRTISDFNEVGALVKKALFRQICFWVSIGILHLDVGMLQELLFRKEEPQEITMII